MAASSLLFAFHSLQFVAQQRATSSLQLAAQQRASILTYGVGRTVASFFGMPRKVRAPQGRVPGNAWAARADGKCSREQTADGPSGIRQG